MAQGTGQGRLGEGGSVTDSARVIIAAD